MAHLYCNGGNRFNFVSIRNYTQNNFGGGYSYGCSMPSFGGIFSNWGTGIYNGCACNGGFNWSTFWGTGCGSLVGSFLGMLCRPNNTSGSNQGQGTTGNNGNDTDYKKINDLIEEINKDKNLINAQTKINSLTENDKTILKATLYRYREKIQNLRDNLDNKMDNENKRQLDNLEAQINELDDKFKINSTQTPEIWPTNNEPANKTTPDTTDGAKNTTGAPTKAGGDTTQADGTAPQNTQTKTQERTLTVPTDIRWNEYNKIPAEWKLLPGYTRPEAKEIINERIIKVEDLSGTTEKIKVKSSTVSIECNNTDNFPEYLEIHSKTGKIWHYKYAGIQDGCPIYITPNTDRNQNVYVLCKQGNAYKLMQFKDFSGYGKGDLQNNTNK